MNRGISLRAIACACVVVVAAGCSGRAEAPAKAKAESAAAVPQTPAVQDQQEVLKARADELIQEALAHHAAGDYARAVAVLEQAKALQPNRTGIDNILSTERSTLKQVVAGKWRFTENVDPMDDSKSTIAMLVASTDDDDRPNLIVRCRSGHFDLYVTEVRASYGASTARIRFDSEPPSTASIGRSDDGGAVFILDREKRITRALSKHSGKLLIEVATYNGRAVVPFDIDGASVAVPKVIDACGGWPKPKRVCNKPWPERCDWEVKDE